MIAATNFYLISAGVLNAVAAALHLGCIAVGAPWYRFLGAGEQMARLAESGSTLPAKFAAAIAAVLLVWSAYAFSGAGVIPRLPLLRPVLCAIALVYLLRGLLFVPLMPFFPGNSLTFWIVTSSICVLLGALHALGLRQAPGTRNQPWRG